MMTFYKPKNILVTGAAGFIGCNFVRHLLKMHNDINVMSYDKLTYAGSLDNLANLPNPQNHTFLQADICDRQQIDQALRNYKIDTIVHFAAESHVDRSISGPADFIQTNIVGTFILLAAAKQYWLDEQKWHATQCRFHHISTDEVYGTLEPDDSAFTEQTAYAPNSPYSASKASSDHLVRAYFHTYKLPITMTNCSNNYGPYQHVEKFIPTIIHACKNWQPIPVYGDGTNIRDWLHVADHCRAIELVIAKGKVGESFNIGGNTELSNIDVVNIICDLMDEKFPKKQSHKTLIKFVPDRAGHDWRYAINIKKICSELKWQPTIPFKEGIKNFIYSLF